jgi:hypothetical protein
MKSHFNILHLRLFLKGTTAISTRTLRIMTKHDTQHMVTQNNNKNKSKTLREQ